MNLAALIKRKQLQFESRMLLIGVTRELCKVTEVRANIGVEPTTRFFAYTMRHS
jgi:hypothetical protein